MSMKEISRKTSVRFGIAGWAYPDWEGIVYPKPKPRGFEPLELIASLADAVEINSSFYSAVAPGSAQKWLRVVAPFQEFRFSAKLEQKFTHEKGEWSRDDAAAFIDGLDPLLQSGRLGALLAQFPWSFRNNEESFARLKKIAEQFKSFPLVLEIRHNSWNTPEIFDWLKQNQIGFANIDQPLFNDSLPATEVATGKVGYVRLHGRNHKNWFRKDAQTWERYDYLYEAKELKQWLPRIKQVSRGTEEMFVIANNHYQGKGLANALMLKAMWSKKKQKAPHTLLDKYPLLREYCESTQEQKELFQ
jgi:uncharacterized protein YecE (DUF72 family)